MEVKSSKDGAEGRPSQVGYRNVVVTRTAKGNNRSSMPTGSMRSSMTLTSSMSPGTYQQLSSSGVTDFKGTRQKEKRDLQGLNERLASYIDRVKFLEAQCQKLENENDILRKRKGEDFEPIRKAYENELAQARKVIDELAGTKGQSEAKLLGLQDEIDSLKDM